MSRKHPRQQPDRWSVRMRASGTRGEHISGAEGIFSLRSLNQAVAAFSHRGLTHPKGAPVRITITIEPLTRPVKPIKTLEVRTLACESPNEADGIIRMLLSDCSISSEAINTALRIVRGNVTMRGAAIVCAASGRRLEPDKQRGVRASMLGIAPHAKTSLLRKLGGLGGSALTALEAITLASKVASAPWVLGELCISDDPDYTTGYVASRTTGYTRIPDIKHPGSHAGGRVFFVSPRVNIARLISYLEETPVMAASISKVSLKPVPPG